MTIASDDERTATAAATRPQQGLICSSQGSERLMTLVDVSQLLGVPVASKVRVPPRRETARPL